MTLKERPGSLMSILFTSSLARLSIERVYHFIKPITFVIKIKSFLCLLFLTCKLQTKRMQKKVSRK